MTRARITGPEITRWFTDEQWLLCGIQRGPDYYFRSGYDLPEGIVREARISLGFSRHHLAMWLRAWNGAERSLHPHLPCVGFANALELESYVHQLGPRSFAHVIERFAREVGTPPRSAA